MLLRVCFPFYAFILALLDTSSILQAAAEPLVFRPTIPGTRVLPRNRVPDRDRRRSSCTYKVLSVDGQLSSYQIEMFLSQPLWHHRAVTGWINTTTSRCEVTETSTKEPADFTFVKMSTINLACVQEMLNCVEKDLLCV